MMRQPFITALAKSLMLGCVTLAACGANQGADRIVTRTVLVPTPVSCVPADLPPRPVDPAPPEALRSAPDAAARYALLAQFWTLMRPFDATLDAVLDACRKAAPPPP